MKSIRKIQIIISAVYLSSSFIEATNNINMVSLIDNTSSTNISRTYFSNQYFIEKYQKNHYVSGEIIVKFKPALRQGTLKSQKACSDIRSNYDAILKSTFKNVQAELWKLNNTNTDVVALSESLSKNSNIEYAEPNYVFNANLIPNDTYFDELWALNNIGQNNGKYDADIDVTEIWDINTGNDIIVAVIDTGVDYKHEDLADNIWVNSCEIPNNGIDDDGNGYIDDIHGINAINNTGDPMDDNGHGTHCSGTIAAIGNNKLGVVGVCWKAKIMACKWLSKDGTGHVSDAIKCIEYALNMGTHVMNNSWGGYSGSKALYEAIEMANETLFCNAAGNDSNNNDTTPAYPASYDLPNIISVAASDASDNLAWFSNYGEISVDIAAPGVDILSTICKNKYDLSSGTSMATPHVAGSAALLLSIDHSLTSYELKKLLMDTTDNIPAFSGKMVTSGRLNVNKAYGVHFDKHSYFSGEILTITLTHKSLKGYPSENITVTTTTGDAETVALSEAEPGWFRFIGNIISEHGNATPYNGIIECEDGVEINIYEIINGTAFNAKAVIDESLEITITTPAQEVPYETQTFQVSGRNNGNVPVEMVILNEATGNNHTFTANEPEWTSPSVTINDRNNIITISGVNEYGKSDSKSVLIKRVGPTGINYVSQTSPRPEWPYMSWHTAAHQVQEAINAAAINNKVVLDDGVYKEGKEVLIYKPITLTSKNGSETTILNGENKYRCLKLLGESIVDNITIRKGYAADIDSSYWGGGVYITKGGILTNCIIEDCKALVGGGIYVWDEGKIINCNIENNNVILNNNVVYGGGIFCYNAIVNNCTINNNRASGDNGLGGGIYCYPNCIVTNCIIRNNTCKTFGGGLFADNSIVDKCRIIGNICNVDGGGIYSYSTKIKNCTISENTTTKILGGFHGRGGGVFAYNNSFVSDCIISNNISLRTGGIYMRSGKVMNSIIIHNKSTESIIYAAGGITFAGTVENCIIKNNKGFIGGVCIHGGNSSLINSLVCHNSCNNNSKHSVGGVFVYSPFTENQTIINCTITQNKSKYYYQTGGVSSHVTPFSIRNSIIYYNEKPKRVEKGVYDNYSESSESNVYFYNSCTTPNPLMETGNITNEPGFVDRYTDIYQLRADSPSINAGNNDYVTSVTDLNNMPRIVDKTVDLGAYEFQYSPSIAYVSTDGSDTWPYDSPTTAARSIQNALNAVAAAGTVLVDSGRYFEDDEIIIDKPIFLKSMNGTANTIIDGLKNNRCLYINHNQALIEGFTITRGKSSYGAGVVLLRGTLKKCTVTGNYANKYGGGGIFNTGLIEDCIISNNSSIASGGGISGGGIIVNCIISDNLTEDCGGGLYLNTTANIDSCTIKNNRAKKEGGGAFLISNISVINNSTIEGNTAQRVEPTIYGKGGGLFLNTGGQVKNCVISFNSAKKKGAGVYFNNGGTLNRCNIKNNVLTGSGGGLYCDGGGILNSCIIENNQSSGIGSEGGGAYLLSGGELNNCTLVNNFAVKRGGGVMCKDGGLVRNCIIFFNFANSSENYYNDGTGINYIYSCTTPLLSGTGNISEEPAFKDSSLYLSKSSPCIDKGNNSYSCSELDFEGYSRIIDGDSDEIATVDMGAYEYRSMAGAWWSRYDVLDDTKNYNDYCVATVGQLKYFATCACDVMIKELTGGPGPDIASIIDGFQDKDNYAVLTVGQLKYVASKFYDRLDLNYPWKSNLYDNSDYSSANIGQLKHCFMFGIP